MLDRLVERVAVAVDVWYLLVPDPLNSETYHSGGFLGLHCGVLRVLYELSHYPRWGDIVERCRFVRSEPFDGRCRPNLSVAIG